MTGPVIDLGELRHEPDSVPLPRPPRANGRPLRCALVLLLLLVTLAAAGPPGRRAVVTLPGQPGTEAFVSGDLFFLLDPLSSQSRQRRLAAFRLPDGEPVWQVPLPVDGRLWGVSEQGGMLLVTGHESDPGGQGALTITLDRATGAYGWQQPGSAVELADGNLLLQSTDGEGAGSLRAVDPCCGTVRWQLSTTPAEINFRGTENGVDRVVLSRPDGQVEVRDATTGTVLARANLGAPGRGPYPTVQVVDDLLVTVGGSPATATAYGLDRLDRRWSATGDGELYVLGCGPVVCLQSPAGGLRAVDPATGRVLWSSGRWGWAWPYDGRLVTTPSESTGSRNEQFVALDPATGDVVAELGRWELAQFGLEDPMVGVRRLPGGGLIVAKLDVRTGEVRVLDVLPDAIGECQASVGRLLCRRMDGSYGLWQLPD
ncbi:PQQ-binding-like beta-propeller repeat protein [Micromonospora sp. NBC_00858]|uniref:outer membrane protein assembly factor BamB family protein n=1 Tax=Micromonospora sp. NBC_00858 TaxID=2975979 RepID=UPI003864FD43|nr:PQQ-like beta-propeller repeat protein [Micromonospora sp. NBC_00858]